MNKQLVLSVVLCFHFLPIAFGQKLLLFNGNIYTSDGGNEKVESIYIDNGIVKALGSSKELLKKYHSVPSLDLNGKAVYPGFHDAHCHFLGYALGKLEANLVGVESISELADRLKEHRKRFPEQSWILGRGWDQNKWPGKQFPDRSLLDSLFPNIPVYLVRVDGHAAYVSSKALQMAGVLDNPIQIEGGEVVSSQGRVTGILVDNAMNLVKKIIPKPDSEVKENLLLQAEKEMLSKGLTYLTDAGLDLPDLLIFEKIYKDKRLKIRLNAMASASQENIQFFAKRGKIKQEGFKVDSYKLYADGALGSRGACLLHPYEDKPQTMGFLLKAPQQLQMIARQVHQQGFQLNTHCIGDSANRTMLGIYAEVISSGNPLRWRIEHAQVIHPQDFSIFGEHKIIPSVQPTHCTSDMYWAEERLGKERISYAYAYRQLLDEAGILACGSDFPVEDINPLYGFHAAVTRQDASGFPDNGFQKRNALSSKEAMDCMTLGAAYAAFEDHRLGKLAIGYQADLVVLESDIMVEQGTQTRNVNVMKTMIAGEWVYQLHD